MITLLYETIAPIRLLNVLVLVFMAFSVSVQYDG